MGTDITVESCFLGVKGASGTEFHSRSETRKLKTPIHPKQLYIRYIWTPISWSVWGTSRGAAEEKNFFSTSVSVSKG